MEIFDKALAAAKEIKNQYVDRKRVEKEDSLNVKAAALQAKEEDLKQREAALDKRLSAVQSRERNVAAKARRPLYVLVASVAALVLIQGYLWTNYTITPKSVSVASEKPALEGEAPKLVDRTRSSN